MVEVLGQFSDTDPIDPRRDQCRGARGGLRPRLMVNSAIGSRNKENGRRRSGQRDAILQRLAHEKAVKIGAEVARKTFEQMRVAVASDVR